MVNAYKPHRFGVLFIPIHRKREELRPYLQKQTTVMRSPVEVERQIAVTLYYLSDEGVTM